MTGPASSGGGGADCCPGSTELMAPLFHTRRQETMATPIVMSRAIEHATKRPIHPCREKAARRKEGLALDPKRGTGISCAGGPSQLADHSNPISRGHGKYPFSTHLYIVA